MEAELTATVRLPAAAAVDQTLLLAQAAQAVIAAQAQVTSIRLLFCFISRINLHILFATDRARRLDCSCWLGARPERRGRWGRPGPRRCGTGPSCSSSSPSQRSSHWRYTVCQISPGRWATHHTASTGAYLVSAAGGVASLQNTGDPAGREWGEPFLPLRHHWQGDGARDGAGETVHQGGRQDGEQ